MTNEIQKAIGSKTKVTERSPKYILLRWLCYWWFCKFGQNGVKGQRSRSRRDQYSISY